MHLVDGRDVLLADGAEDFAAAILRVHDDATLWNSLSANGLGNVARHFSIDAARGVVQRLFAPTN
jgi:hypothetical protein